MSCGVELPGSRRLDMRYCGVRCRVRAHRIRKGEGEHVRPTKKHGHTALKVALGTVAAATAAAAAIELVRESQDERLVERERKITEQQEQLRKSQSEKEELQRASTDLRNRVEQVTKEKKEKEAQLLQKGKELDAEKETVKTLRRSLAIARQEWEESDLRLIFETQAKEDAKNAQLQLAAQYQRLLSDTSQQRAGTNQQVHVLMRGNDKLERQLANAKDKQEVQLAKIAESKESPPVAVEAGERSSRGEDASNT